MFSRLLGRKLSAAWQYSASGVLWRLFPQADGLLLGEDRDPEKKTVSFFCLDDRTGVVRWKDLTFAEPWWISMEALHHDILILHEYAAPDMPDHKKISAVDAASGRVLWTNADAKYLFAHGDCVYAARETFEERLFSEIRLSDGLMLREVGAPEMHDIQRSLGAQVQQPIRFPDIARSGEQADPELDAILSAAGAPARVEDQTEYILTSGHLVVARSSPTPGARAEPSFEQQITIYDRARRRSLFIDLMNARLSMPVPDMFFCKNDHLYYIKEKRTLSAVYLRPPS